MTLAHIDASPIDIPNDSGLKEWWRKHQEQDAARQAREEHKKRMKKVADRAYNKLTKEEREALGLT